MHLILVLNMLALTLAWGFQLNPLPYSDSIVSKSKLLCIETAIQHLFVSQDGVTIYAEDSRTYAKDNMLSVLHNEIMLTGKYSVQNLLFGTCPSAKSENFIVYLPQAKSFDKFNKLIRRCLFWHEESRIVILTETEDVGEYLSMLALIENVYDERLAFIMFINLERYYVHLTVYIWHTKQDCRLIMTKREEVLTDQCSDIVTKLYAPINSLNCPLRVGLNVIHPFVLNIPRNQSQNKSFFDKYDGIEIRMLKIISKTTGLTFQDGDPIMLSEVWRQKSILSLFSGLRSREFDLLVGGFRLQYTDLNGIVFSQPYLRDQLFAVVKRDDSETLWGKEFQMFNLNAWLIYFAIFTSSFLIPSIVTKLVYSLQWLYVFDQFQAYVLINIGMPAGKRTLRRTAKLLFLFWTWSSFFYRLCYQTFLIEMLLRYVDLGIDTLDDLCRQEYSICLTESTEIKLSEQKPDDQSKSCYFRPEFLAKCASIEDCLNYASRNKKYGCIVPYLYYEEEKWRYVDKQTGYLSLHRVKEVIMGYPLVMFFRAGSPLVPIFNKYLRIFMESGLLVKEIKDLNSLTQQREFLLPENSAKVMPLEQLKTTFVILICCYLLSFVAFVGEIFIYHFSSRKHI